MCQGASNLQELLHRGLVCPCDHSELTVGDSVLTCRHGHQFPVVQDVPILLLTDVRQTIGIAEESIRAAWASVTGAVPEDPYFIQTLGISDNERAGLRDLIRRAQDGVDPVVQYMVGATNGILYRDLVGTLGQYPIPELRLSPGEGRRLLDVGCNWGRWMVAAARRGFVPVGIDPSLGAVLAAKRVCAQLGVAGHFVVGDARHLPFAADQMDAVFSYSVIQHFGYEDAELTFAQFGRVLRGGGECLIQMPSQAGVRCLYHQLRRGFRNATSFEVRYWSIPKLRRSLTAAVGPVDISVEGFFGIGLQPTDAPLMTRSRRVVLRASERLRRASAWCWPLLYVADSLYARAHKAEHAGTK